MYHTTKKYVYCFACIILCLLLAGQAAQAQDNAVPTVKVRRHKKKVKKVKPSRAAAPVKVKHQRPRSQNTNFSHKDQYRPPRSMNQSEPVKDNYQRPKSFSSSGNVKVSDARSFSEPDAEEGKKKSHLPFIDQIFNRHNSYFRQKKRYLQNMSYQLGGYQGDWRVRKKNVSPGGGYEDKSIGSFSGHIKRPHPAIQKKVEKNISRYTHQHPGWLRVPSPRAQARYHKKLATQMHGHQGSIKVKRRRPGDNMHPSVHHMARVGKASYEQKERHRKRRIWITHVFKSKEQPQHLKEKVRKPRYDSKEAEIWNY